MLRVEHNVLSNIDQFYTMPDNRKSNNEFRAGRITFTVVSIDPVERRAVLKPVETSSALRFLMKL